MRGRLIIILEEWTQEGGAGRRILASFAKGVVAHSVWYFCFQRYCLCENPACWSQLRSCWEQPKLCWLLLGSGRLWVVAFSLSLSEILMPLDKTEEFCFLQCWKWAGFKKTLSFFFLEGSEKPFHSLCAQNLLRVRPREESFHFLNFPIKKIHMTLLFLFSASSNTVTSHFFWWWRLASFLVKKCELGQLGILCN